MLGRSVSHYDVLYSLGSGGMGDVYAARDTLLGRMVAIKVLQGPEVADGESCLRFLQEARAASALNHPNIVTIYDVVRDRGADCIVMELVTGQTLADRIRKGPVPLAEALEIVDRIADALAVAHRSGIIHRDLKPGNVMLTESGGVKILDFGLAKITAESEIDQRHTSPRTQSGMVIGTPCFMSPEQALGKALDARSDLFSLGTIAVEMLTGANPFEADSAVATMHEIAYGGAPSFENVPVAAIPMLEKLLTRDRDRRYQTAGEVRAAIAELRESPALRAAGVSVRKTMRGKPPLRRAVMVVAARRRSCGERSNCSRAIRSSTMPWARSSTGPRATNRRRRHFAR